MQASTISFQPSIKSQVSFTSGIKFVSKPEFKLATEGLVEKVDTPFSEYKTLIGRDALKRWILDCTAVFVTDGKRVVSGHFDPFKTDFASAKAGLIKKIKKLQQDKLHGFLVGSQSKSSQSLSLFQNFQGFLSSNNIPYSMFRGHLSDSGASSVAYFGKGDLLLITNEDISEEVLKEKKKPLSEILLSVYKKFKLSKRHDHFVED